MEKIIGGKADCEKDDGQVIGASEIHHGAETVPGLHKLKELE